MILTFVGRGDSIFMALSAAQRQFDTWYDVQRVRFTGDGGSAIQVSGSLAPAAPYDTADGRYIYTLTVFDWRGVA